MNNFTVISCCLKEMTSLGHYKYAPDLNYFVLGEATLAIFIGKGPKTGRGSGLLLLNVILKTVIFS